MVIDKFLDEIETNNIANVKKMLSDGIDPNVCYEDGYSALEIAASNDNFDIIKMLLEAGADPDSRLPGQKSALMLLCARGSSDIKSIKILLEAGANVNLKDKYGHTALMLAAISHANLDIFVLLLVAGADPMIKDERGRTALDMAKLEGNLKIVKFLEKYMMFLALSNMYHPKKKFLPKELVRKIIEAL
jgi:hypothetical protein